MTTCLGKSCSLGLQCVFCLSRTVVNFCIYFLCPRHKMAEGHIEFTMIVCSRRTYLCALYCKVGFENNFAQMVI